MERKRAGERDSKEFNNVERLHSDGSDLIGSKVAEAEEEAVPSREADDCSCCLTVAGVSVVKDTSVEAVTSEST